MRVFAGIVLALVLASCTRGTPESRFSEALESRFDGAFAFEVTVEADRSSLNELGEGARAAADFLQGLRISGVVDDNEAARLELSAFGVDNLAQLLVLGTEALYVRAAVAEFSAAAETEPLDTAAVRSNLVDADLEPAVIDGVLGFLDGDWVGLTGLEDLGDLAGGDADDDQLDVDEAAGALGDVLGGDVAGFVERFVTLTETVDGDTTRYDVSLDVAGLVQASMDLNARLGLGGAVPSPAEDVEDMLGSIPATVPGVVVVRDGVLSEVSFDIADAVRQQGTEVTGSIVVRVTFDDGPATLVAPDGAQLLTTEQLGEAVTAYVAHQAQQAFEKLQEQYEELQGGGAGPTPTPTPGS